MAQANRSNWKVNPFVSPKVAKPAHKPFVSNVSNKLGDNPELWMTLVTIRKQIPYIKKTGNGQLVRKHFNVQPSC